MRPDDAYGPINRLLRPTPYSAEARSVTVGNSPGWVFSDEDAEPAAAVIGSRGMEGFWLFSDAPQAELTTAIRTFVEHDGRALLNSVGYNFLEMSTSNDQCGAAIQDALSPSKVDVSRSLILTNDVDVSHSPPDHSLPVVSVSEALHLQPGHLNLADKVSLFWGDQSRFDAVAAMGFCVVVDGTATSLCMSAFIDDDVHCVDMETDERFWRQGHGLAAANAFLAACRERGLTMHWSSMESNVASYKLARRLGLRQVGDYMTYSIEY